MMIYTIQAKILNIFIVLAFVEIASCVNPGCNARGNGRSDSGCVSGFLLLLVISKRDQFRGELARPLVRDKS